MLDVALTAFATFFVIIDPIGVVPLFVGLTSHMDGIQRRRTAVRAVIIATGILLTFTVLGQPMLSYLGISLPAFRIAGGILLLLLAVDMVVVKSSGIRTTTPKEDEEATHRPDVTVFPLAIPLIAGPGSITAVILQQSHHAGHLIERLIVAGVMVGVLAMLVVGLLSSGFIMRLLGVTGVNVITRVFGIILTAVAVSNIIEGIRASFPALG